MSAVLEPAAGAAPGHVPSGPAPAGGLLRSEVHRFAARRFLRVLAGLALLGWAAAVVIGLGHYGHPSAQDLAQARAQVAEAVRSSNEGREQCLADPARPVGPPVEEHCGPVVTERDVPLEVFLLRPPFSFAGSAQSGALGFAAVAAVLAFLAGATWIGAEWSTRSIVALLIWEPRRLRVLAAKLAVLAGGAVLLGVLAQGAWLGMAGLLSAVAGDGATLPAGFWGDLAGTGLRGVLFVVLAAVSGLGLANLVRNTGAALGVGFVYVAIAETALRALRPGWEPWLLSTGAVGLLTDGGLRLSIYDPATVDAAGVPVVREYLVTNVQGGLVLTGVAAVLVAAGAVLFVRRDLH